MGKKRKNGPRGSDRNASTEEPRTQVNGAADQEIEVTGTESFDEDLDTGLLPDSMRKEYFTAEHEDVEQVEEENLDRDQVREPETSPESNDDQETDSTSNGVTASASESRPGEDEEKEGPAESVESGRKDDRDDSALATPLVEHKKHVRNINKIALDTIETGGWQIARYVADEVCKGDPQVLSSKDPKKKASLRKVFDDPELLIHSRRAGEFAGAEFFRRDLVKHNISAPNLMMTHIIALLPLKDEKLRRQLAEEANSNKYSVRKIAERVKEENRKALPEDMGKKILRMLESSLRPLEDNALVQICSDKDTLLRDLSSADRENILRRINEGKSRFESLDKFVGELEGRLTEIEQESRPIEDDHEADDAFSNE